MDMRKANDPDHADQNSEAARMFRRRSIADSRILSGRI
jgi:ribosomal 50S subunit-recycling heat shock protein